MKIFTLLVLLVFPITSYAQIDHRQYNQFVSVTGGRSTHGTGDMKGISQEASFVKYFRKKLFWSASVGGSLHDGLYSIASTQSDGKILDHSYRYTAGGIQVSGGVGYSIIRSKRSEAGVRLDGFLRFQSSSFYDQLLIIDDPKSGTPYPALYIFNLSPQRTYSAGFAPEIFYSHSISKTLFLGASAGFQADTNGDVITNISLSIGKRFE